MTENLDDLIQRRNNERASELDELLNSPSENSENIVVEGDQLAQAPSVKDVILIVDDDPSQLLSIKKMISSTYELLTCDRGLKAIELYRQEQDKFK